MLTEGALGWNPVSDVQQLLTYQFMDNALAAGAVVALMAGVIGWFVVLRRQTFAAHTLALMSFPGASGAALIGIPAAWGYFGCCALAALAIAGGPDPISDRREASAAIGMVQAVGLAAGFLFLYLYSGILGNLETLLFGTYLGVTKSQVIVLAAVAAGALLALGAAFRPLLLASIDPQVARARGLPVRALSTGFVLLVGLAVAATSQITGALLVFALIVAPPATAQALTTRPGLGLMLSVVFALAVTWVGLALAYFLPSYPVGFYITTLAFAAYVAARLLSLAKARRRYAPARLASAPT